MRVTKEIDRFLRQLWTEFDNSFLFERVYFRGGLIVTQSESDEGNTYSYKPRKW